MKLKALICALLVTTQLATPAPVLAATDNPSAHLQCDGNPNNMSAGEGIARFIGAVTLLALFAPQRESPDDDARLFGEEGVAICNSIIDGEKAEGNVARRLPLITARAIHHIEALNYDAALVDIAKARQESIDAGLAGDIYYDRSFGQSLDRIESAALLRLGRVEEAKQVALRKAVKYPNSLFVVGFVDGMVEFSSDVSEEQIAHQKSLARGLYASRWGYINHLQLAGKWQEAADANESYLAFFRSLEFEELNSSFIAMAALSNLTADNIERAGELAKEARDNLDSRRMRGKPDASESAAITMLDFHDILLLAKQGDMREARLRYGSRSEWPGLSSALRLHASQLLREGAAEDELRGALAKSEETLREERSAERLAQLLENDKNNKTLFDMIRPYADAARYENLSKNVWRIEKSRMLSDTEDETISGMYLMEAMAPAGITRVDAMLLHAALSAKAKGKSGFNFIFSTSGSTYSFVRFGDIGDPEISEALFFDADEVIAELSEAIPAPEMVKARKEQRRLERKQQKRAAKNKNKD